MSVVGGLWLDESVGGNVSPLTAALLAELCLCLLLSVPAMPQPVTHRAQDCVGLGLVGVEAVSFCPEWANEHGLADVDG